MSKIRPFVYIETKPHIILCIKRVIREDVVSLIPLIGFKQYGDML